MTDSARGAPSLTVVVIGNSRRRAVVPTVRSVMEAADEISGWVEILVVETPSRTDELRSILTAASLTANVLTAEPSDAMTSGVNAATSEIVAVLDAGDLVSASWLRDGMTAVSMCEGLLHPAAVLVYGDHIGWWHQPPSDRSWLLPIAAPWASPVIARRDRVQALAAAACGGPRHYVPPDMGLLHGIVPGTSAFVRSWDGVAPWEIPKGDLLPARRALRDRERARRVPPLATAQALPAPIGSAMRIARTAAQPWIAGGRARLRRFRGLSAYPDAILAEWRRANRLEPLIPFPRAEFNVHYRARPAEGSVDEREWADAYARLVVLMPPRVDYLFIVPWLRMGGGDTVTRAYIDAIRRLDPDASVAVLTTEPVASTALGGLDADVARIELRHVVDLHRHRSAMVERVLPQLISQYRPSTIHVFNSTVGFDIVERYGQQLARHSDLFLSSFAIDRDPEGERTSVMFLRRPGFLDPVRKVLVDSEHYVDAMVHELGYARDKFTVQNHVVDLPFRSREVPLSFTPQRPLRVLWAGRFDLPKRLDILARIAEGARESGLPMAFDFYGAEVMGHPHIDDVLRRLALAGATRHPPYVSFHTLPLDRFDAYLMTSEWEGIPHTVLEAMSVGIPVIAPLVGGIGEVLDESTGYPVGQFDRVEDYLDALQALLHDYKSARVRAQAARTRIDTEFSSGRFDRTLMAIPGYIRAQV